MKSKYSTCAYADYFAEYSMRTCNHPDMVGKEADCKNCSKYFNPKASLMNCPLCNKHPHFGEYCGEWHIECKCGLKLEGEDPEKLVTKWNSRRQ